MSGVTGKQFDRYARMGNINHLCPLYLPFGTTVSATMATYFATKTDLTLAPATTAVAGSAVTITSVSATTDAFTLTAHGYGNGQALQIAFATTMAAPLVALTTYYVVNRTSSTFQLAFTPGGPAIDLTTAGSGAITATIPAGFPWIVYNGEPMYVPALPAGCSIWTMINDAASADALVVARFTGHNWYGGKIEETLGGIAGAAGVNTSFQTNRAFSDITKIEVLSAGTTAAGDVLQFGLSNGINSSLTLLPRANIGIPLKKPIQGCIKMVTWGNAAGSIIMNPTINTTYGTFTLGTTVAHDASAANAGYGMVILDPTAVL